jgi:hypothetical protein
MKIALAVLILLAIVAAAVLLPVRPYLDFQVIYHANLGLLRGIPLYDHAGQMEMIAELAMVPVSQVLVLPFPYPPWYALSTLWLALLPIGLAARVWFGLSLLMLIVSAGLLTHGQPTAKRVLLSLGAILWMPVLGGLFVGQYGFPVLLGAALMTYALRRENAELTAIAAALLTFKPHLGGLVLLLVMINLAMRRDRFGRSALLAVILAGALLLGLGFLTSPRWPVDYLHSLIGFRNFGGVSRCEQCVSLSIALARLGGGGLNQAAWISAVIAILLGAWLFRRWRHLTSPANGLVVPGILLTLLVSPYLLNYDYLLLVAAFILLARDARRANWIGLALAFALPLVSLALLGTKGNNSLILSTLLAAALFARRLAKADALRQLDVTQHPS